MFKLDSEKVDSLPTELWGKPFDCVDHNKLWKMEILKDMGVPDHLTCLLWNLMQIKKQQLKLDMEQETG